MLHLQLSDHDVERLIAGDQPKDRPDYAEVALLMRRLRAEGVHERVPPMSSLLLAELDKAEADAAASQRSDRAETRRKVTEARRRWRVMAAAAAIVVLAGIGVAHAQGAFSADEPTHTVDVSSGGADLGPDDGAGDGQDDTFTAEVPPVEATGPTPPPPTDPPVTEAPPPETTTGDTDHDGDRDRDGDRRGDDGDWDRDGRWDWDDEFEWNPRQTERGVEVDVDGEGGMPPFVFEQEWWDACDGDRWCLWQKWWEANGDRGPGGAGPDVYSQSDP